MIPSLPEPNTVPGGFFWGVDRSGPARRGLMPRLLVRSWKSGWESTIGLLFRLERELPEVKSCTCHGSHQPVGFRIRAAGWNPQTAERLVLSSEGGDGWDCNLKPAFFLWFGEFIQNPVRSILVFCQPHGRVMAPKKERRSLNPRYPSLFRSITFFTLTLTQNAFDVVSK